MAGLPPNSHLNSQAELKLKLNTRGDVGASFPPPIQSASDLCDESSLRSGKGCSEQRGNQALPALHYLTVSLKTLATDIGSNARRLKDRMAQPCKFLIARLNSRCRALRFDFSFTDVPS